MKTILDDATKRRLHRISAPLSLSFQGHWCMNINFPGAGGRTAQWLSDDNPTGGIFQDAFRSKWSPMSAEDAIRTSIQANEAHCVLFNLPRGPGKPISICVPIP